MSNRVFPGSARRNKLYHPKIISSRRRSFNWRTLLPPPPGRSDTHRSASISPSRCSGCGRRCPCEPGWPPGSWGWVPDGSWGWCSLQPRSTCRTYPAGWHSSLTYILVPGYTRIDHILQMRWSGFRHFLQQNMKWLNFSYRWGRTGLLPGCNISSCRHNVLT